MMTDYDVAIIGAGIVGSTLASLLAPHTNLVLIDRSVRGLHGSTGHAPGFVGQLNTLAPLTELAKRTVKHYTSVPGGFDIVGGLEVARSEAEEANLTERAQLAHDAGLAARLVSASDAAELAPAFIDGERVTAALHFPNDGTANARHLATAGQDAAESAGAKLLDADVTAITKSESGPGYTLTTSTGTFTAAHVVVCTGVWASQLLPTLSAAAVSVAHPYAYSSQRTQRPATSPFIRWPAAHVYARDHGVRDGIGSYDHDPVHVSATACARMPSAYGEWEPAFDSVIDRALGLLPAQTAETFGPIVAPAPAAVDTVKATDVPYVFNGLFTVTPDGMPLVGHLEGGLWCAVGVWVTHAAGSAGLLAGQILSAVGKGPKPSIEDEGLGKAVDPKRFAGLEAAVLERKALASYNDIYNKEA